MYQPALRPDQFRSLYLLKQASRMTMTRLAREAVDVFLAGQRQRLEEESSAAVPERLQSRSAGLRTPRPPRFSTWV